MKVAEVTLHDLVLDLLELYHLLSLLYLLLLLDLLLNHSLLVFLSPRLPLFQVELSIIVVARMLFLQDLAFEVEIIYSASGALAWLPGAWQWSFETFFGYIE